MDLQSQSIEFFKKNYPSHEFKEEAGLKILITATEKNLPVLVIWAGRQRNPFVRYRYNDADQLQKALDYYVRIANEISAHKAAKAAKKKAFVPSLKVGDILCSSWGYEQTNVSFYQVIEVPSNHFVVVHEIHQETVAEGGCNMSAYVKGVKDSFIEKYQPTRHKVIKWGDSQAIRITSCETASLWDGTQQYKSWYY